LAARDVGRCYRREGDAANAILAVVWVRPQANKAGIVHSVDDGTVPPEGTCFDETIPCYGSKNSLFH
jgi:hypothetical protein